MIGIVYEPEECKLTVGGHADYAEKGSDIVCAAISALYQTLLLRENTYEIEGVVDNVRMAFSDRPMWDQPIFTAIAKGMERIAQQYPDHVRYRETTSDKGVGFKRNTRK